MAERTGQSPPSHFREFVFLLSPQICPPSALAHSHVAQLPWRSGKGRGTSLLGDIPERMHGSRHVVWMGMHPSV